MTVNIGVEIKAVLHTKGMSISEFARRIGTSRENAYSIFNRTSIDTELLLKICRVLEYDFFSLYKNGFTGPPTRDEFEELKKEVEFLKKILAA